MKEIKIFGLKDGICPGFFHLTFDPGDRHDFVTLLFGSDTELADAWIAQAIVQTVDKNGGLEAIAFLVNEIDFEEFGEFKLSLPGDDNDHPWR